MLFHFAKFSAGKNNRQYKCSCVGNRSCIHNAIDSHKHREDNDQWKQEDHLSGERHDDTEDSLSYRSKNPEDIGWIPFAKVRSIKILR